MHLAWAFVVLTGAVPQEQTPVNAYCPVMSSERSTSAHTIRWHRRTIGFCCRGCLELFAAEPYLYEDALPLGSWERTGIERPLATPFTVPLALAVLAAVAGAGWKFKRRGLLKVVAVGSGVAAAASILATLLFSRWVRIWGMDGLNVFSVIGRELYGGSLLAGAVGALIAGLPGLRAALIGPVVRRPLVAAAAVAALLVAGTAAAAPWRRSLTQKREERIHYTTFAEHGRPPAPKAPATAPGFGGAYYRGNDERTDLLFNRGNYRTCTFDLSIESADGRRLQPGDVVGPGDLQLVLRIERAANTQQELFAASILRRCFLTSNADPFFTSKDDPRNASPFVVKKADWSWEGRLPIRRPADGPLEGTIYLREDRLLVAPEDELGVKDVYEDWEVKPRYHLVGSRFHYGARYELAIREGRLQPGSRLWMGELYRTRRFTLNELPAEQWFSAQPIPTLPAPVDRRATAPDSEDF